MCCGGEPDDQQPAMRVSEGWHGPGVVRLPLEGGAWFAGDIAAPVTKTRAALTAQNVLVLVI